MIDLTPFVGKMNDLDTHITPTPEFYENVAGKEAGKFYADMCRKAIDDMPETERDSIPEIMGTEATDYNEKTVWNLKGSGAAGAYTSEGRLKALDYMGVNRAFVFADPALQMGAFSDSPMGISAMRGWNDYSIAFSRTEPKRLLPVAILNTHNIAAALDEAKRLLKAGIRAFVIASSIPPGGGSPAHANFDPLWALLQEANATAILHAGGEQGFMASDAWSKGVDHLSFETSFRHHGEPGDTYMMASFIFSPQNFLATIILGGVFERFPRLRFAVVELGSVWFAPLAMHLDNVAKIFKHRLKGVLSMTPSDYMRRNIRVTPYRFEPVGDLVERFGFDECYCYSSDFPHPEGGRTPIQDFEKHIERLGQRNAEKFYVTNSEWVMPAVA
ncbi:MAG: amidohydrolase family protein [Alcaligenaceae bacterium]